jgi:hypothetical protein
MSYDSKKLHVTRDVFSPKSQTHRISLALTFHFIYLLSGALNIDSNLINHSLFRTYPKPPGINLHNIIGGSLPADDQNFDRRNQPSIALKRPRLPPSTQVQAIVVDSPSSTMTDTAQAVVGTSFAPKTLFPVSAGCTTENLYPVVDTTMLVHERAHAFQMNKTTLSLQALELRVMLDALGAQLNLSAFVEGMIEELLWFFQDSWFDISILQILSFHNNAGGQVNNTTTAANPAISRMGPSLIVVKPSSLYKCS